MSETLAWYPSAEHKNARLQVGKSLLIQRGNYTYPFRKPIALPFESILRRKDPIMYLHISMENEEGEGHLSYARRLLEVVQYDLSLLAMLTTHPDFAAIKAFLGLSHLALVAKRYGFEVFPIPNKRTRNKYKNDCMEILNGMYWVRGYFNDARERNLKDPQMAVITPQRLSELYLQR